MTATYCGRHDRQGHGESSTCGQLDYGNQVYQCADCMAKLVAELKAENEALRLDAERYRFVSELAWYVDAAARTYNLCNINARWSDQRGNPDRDDVEERIDRERTGEPEPKEDGYT